jgi:soluble lytic murein transglycosylase-like protein
VFAGARYLRLLLDRYGSVELALSAYNAGPAAVERAGVDRDAPIRQGHRSPRAVLGC